MNKVILKGRVTAEPNIRTHKNGDKEQTFATFTLAVEDRTYKEGDSYHVDWIQCNASGALAKIIEKNVKKGQELLVAGKYRTGKYQNKDGETIYTNAVFLQELYFCGKKATNEPQEDFVDVSEEELGFK